MKMITVKCKTKNCENNGVEIEVQLSHVICGVCNAVLNEMLPIVDESAKAKAEADKAALLERLGLTEDELKIILG